MTLIHMIAWLLGSTLPFYSFTVLKCVPLHTDMMLAVPNKCSRFGIMTRSCKKFYRGLSCRQTNQLISLCIGEGRQDADEGQDALPLLFHT